MSLKYLPLIGTLALAAPAHAITINMSGFFFGSPTSVDMVGTSGSPSYDGAAGEFAGGSIVTETFARPLSLAFSPAWPLRASNKPLVVSLRPEKPLADSSTAMAISDWAGAGNRARGVRPA